MNASQNKRYSELMDALQVLEEIGGVDSTEEYIEIMEKLEKEVATRIAAAKSTLVVGE